MPKTAERFPVYLGVRIESTLSAKIKRHIKGLKPPVSMPEWVRRVLWEAVTPKPQQPKEKLNHDE